MLPGPQVRPRFRLVFEAMAQGWRGLYQRSGPPGCPESDFTQVLHSFSVAVTLPRDPSHKMHRLIKQRVRPARGGLDFEPRPRQTLATETKKSSGATTIWQRHDGTTGRRVRKP